MTGSPRPDTIGFLGSIPAAYEQYLVPLLFEPFAAELAPRVARLEPGSVLELACGTGILTRKLRAALPHGTGITATDLSEAMLDQARRRQAGEGSITWQPADACLLPFPDASVDLVVCQFGLMFFPDRHIVEFFPENPPSFYQVPYSLSDQATTRDLFPAAGFAEVELETVALEGRAGSALDAATGMVIGTPALGALQERDVRDPAPIIARLASRLERLGGRAPFRIPMQAIVISARKGVV